MTRAAKALHVADAALREAIQVRDPVALARASAEYEDAARRVARQKEGVTS